MVAHFIVFRRRGDEVAKGICRYQQCWAVNRIVRWVVEGEHRRGLVWPAQPGAECGLQDRVQIGSAAGLHHAIRRQMRGRRSARHGDDP